MPPLPPPEIHASKSKNKAPGKSEIRMDHICAANKTCRRLIHSILSLAYTSGKTFSSWDHEIINWIPKEPGNPALDRRRPIALLEVMKKLTLGVKKQQVFDVWIKHDLLDKDNFAVMPGKFISDPLLIKRLLLEDARWLGQKHITLDVDYKAAFDKVPYFIKEIKNKIKNVPQKAGGPRTWHLHVECS
jgi:hypothetical protein